MSLHFASFFKTCILFLLSLDSKMKALLSKICWFVPVTSLEKDESEYPNQLENDFSVNWSQLWLSAQTLYTELFASGVVKVERKYYVKPLISLNIRKRYELLFLFLVSSLRHMMTCRHSSGAPGNLANLTLIVFQKHNARFRHCAFFIT
ncbi:MULTISPECIES: hypothetical protein [Providencia]|uniref:Uncharacterized protein n=2 Tax=Providencia rettgeri TaxID=587 RepID=A0AB35LBV8_PRORE|nr:MULTISPECIES: hypothetical protein [Providencia]QIF58747.1 hypothetical protein FVA69_15400 [Providencia sp. 1701011]QIF62771.1 hypothetical protein FVA70_15425 [Providencia sp. 1701091]EHZ7765777.1 hypothetical protein [Providencia rettgeri]EIJ7168919.1 hypothetical protein [Providencia rettgeri]EJD6046248.1 hypothetical protein [Providencia rettgeri]